MSRNDSDRINDHFAVSSRDLTPASARHTARLLYVPVSCDPEVTRRCASLLADTELQRADRFVAPWDKTLFIQRRAFRRFCGTLALASSQSLSQIAFIETENGRPHLADRPDYWFSFSSCRFGFVGGWSSTHAIGIDIEDRTRDLQATELARQFFSAAEARAVKRPDGLASLHTFLQFWSLKEAALKSIGEGLPFGLDAFEFKLDPKLCVVNAPTEHGGPEKFAAHVMADPHSYVALVIRSPS
jgi:phosphopantetheinyl transferase